MPTTIITDSQPVTRTQYGVRLPDGREFWATGYLKVEDDQITVLARLNGNSIAGNGQLNTLTAGLFRNHDLANLTMDPQARTAATGQTLSISKGEKQTAVQKYRDLMRTVARDTGIDPAEYEKGISILSREVILMVGATTEHRVGMYDEPAEQEPTTAKDEDPWALPAEDTGGETA